VGYGYGHGASIIPIVLIILLFVIRMSAARRRRGQTGGASMGFRAGPPGARPQGPIGPQGPFGPQSGPAPNPSEAPADNEGWGVTRTGIPAGWFPDPSARHEMRYWSGTAWTEHVRDGDTPGTDHTPDETS
jgi:hypothetical protein